MRMYDSEVYNSQRMILYFKDVISVSIFMLSGPSVSTQFREQTAMFPWIDNMF
jgi:hypothetical protein